MNVMETNEYKIEFKPPYDDIEISIPTPVFIFSSTIEIKSEIKPTLWYELRTSNQVTLDFPYKTKHRGSAFKIRFHLNKHPAHTLNILRITVLYRGRVSKHKFNVHYIPENIPAPKPVQLFESQPLISPSSIGPGVREISSIDFTPLKAPPKTIIEPKQEKQKNDIGYVPIIEENSYEKRTIIAYNKFLESEKRMKSLTDNEFKNDFIEMLGETEGITVDIVTMPNITQAGHNHANQRFTLVKNRAGEWIRIRVNDNEGRGLLLPLPWQDFGGGHTLSGLFYTIPIREGNYIAALEKTCILTFVENNDWKVQAIGEIWLSSLTTPLNNQQANDALINLEQRLKQNNKKEIIDMVSKEIQEQIEALFKKKIEEMDKIYRRELNRAIQEILQQQQSLTSTETTTGKEIESVIHRVMSEERSEIRKMITSNKSKIDAEISSLRNQLSQTLSMIQNFINQISITNRTSRKEN